MAVWCQTLFKANGILMEDAIWNIPEHIGWQIIHAHEQSNGNPRKFSNRIKCDNTFDSFRNIIVPEDQETDTLNL